MTMASEPPAFADHEGPTDPNGSGNSAPPPDDWSYSAQPYGYYTWQSD